MRIARLQVEQFRLFQRLELPLDPGLNLFVGDNGSGKTSLLEAIHLLAYGRSFRGGVRDGLIRQGQAWLRVVLDLARDESATPRRLGLQRGVRDWEARIDGQPVLVLSDLYRELAAVCFEPGSHELIGGGSEQRRRFLDWGLFHVEPRFLLPWRRYQRALRQRNALLKAGGGDSASLSAWEAELGESGEQLQRQRERYLARLAPRLEAVANRFLPELGPLRLRLQRGWPQSSDTLAQALQASRPRDAALGHTSVGPHRADWTPGYETLTSPQTFSRGQEKLTALACVLAQADVHASVLGHWPVLLLDDLASELDPVRTELALALLAQIPAQVLLTGTAAPVALQAWPGNVARFHVEQGQVRRLL